MNEVSSGYDPWKCKDLRDNLCVKSSMIMYQLIQVNISAEPIKSHNNENQMIHSVPTDSICM